MRAKAVVISLVAGAVAGLVGNIILFPAWDWLGWRKPVADWLIGFGYSWIAGQWGMLWINLPSYVAASVLGSGLGLFAREHWRLFAVVAAFGFLFGPHMLLLVPGIGPHPWRAFPVSMMLRSFAWESISVPLVFFAAWCGTKMARPTIPACGPAQRGDNP